MDVNQTKIHRAHKYYFYYKMMKLTAFAYLAVVIVLMEQVNAMPEPLALAISRRITRTNINKDAAVTNAQVSTEAIKNPLLVENQEAAVELITLPARETVTMVMAPVVPREIANVEVKNIGEKMLVVIKKEDTPIPVVPKEIANVEVKNLGEKTVVVIKKEDTPVQQEIANEEVKNPEEKTAVVSKKKEGLRRRRVINVDWDTLVDIVADILDEEGLLNDDVDADMSRFYYDF